VSNPHTDPSKKDLVYLLLVLAAVAGLLFTIFSFLATADVGETVALILFPVVGGLVIAGYMVGLMVLCFAAILPLAKRIDKPSKHP
jgi:type IV secretory pathway VirB6-like protein